MKKRQNILHSHKEDSEIEIRWDFAVKRFDAVFEGRKVFSREYESIEAPKYAVQEAKGL